MSNLVIWAMSPNSDDFHGLPKEYQELAKLAYEEGYCNFWYHPDYGLYADAPNANMEDDRMLLSFEMFGGSDERRIGL